MSERDLLTTVPGFYVLKRNGELGYIEQQQWRVDADFTSVFLDYNRSLLNAYLTDGRNTSVEGDAVRVGVVGCPSQGGQKWGSRTLILETAVLTNLYRVHGSRPNELTEFQKRCRQQSIYRGMELLLEYRREELQGVPIYCPVLFDRGTRLDRYPAILDRPPTTADADTPVLEVLNLLAPIPVTLRHHPVLVQLINRIHQKIVNKDLRAPPALSLLASAIPSDAVSPCELFKTARFTAKGENDSASEARAGGHALDMVAQDAVGHVEIRARVARVAGSLGIERIASQVVPDVLKKFDRLRKLDHSRLVRLAGKCRVYTASPGTVILKRGACDPGTLFLLDGKLRLKAIDKVAHVIDSDSRQARAPIAQLKPRMYSVRAHTRVTFLWLQDAYLEEVSSRPAPTRNFANLPLASFPANGD